MNKVNGENIPKGPRINYSLRDNEEDLQNGRKKSLIKKFKKKDIVTGILMKSKTDNELLSMFKN
jgi:hypothetical protein